MCRPRFRVYSQSLNPRGAGSLCRLSGGDKYLWSNAAEYLDLVAAMPSSSSGLTAPPKCRTRSRCQRRCARYAAPRDATPPQQPS